uniref:Uncharacterized protein n=1 Tax=Chelydra serpentina TaxID=8475 RepID=A0A8C3SEM5_CHESE
MCQETGSRQNPVLLAESWGAAGVSPSLAQPERRRRDFSSRLLPLRRKSPPTLSTRRSWTSPDGPPRTDTKPSSQIPTAVSASGEPTAQRSRATSTPTTSR